MLAHIFAALALLCLIIGLQNNVKSRVLIFQILSNAFFGLQYVLLGLTSACLTSFIALLRCVAFYFYERKHGTKAPTSWFVFFTAATIVFPLLAYDGWVSLLPILATGLYSYAIWQKNLKRFRKIAAFVPLIWLVHALLGGAYVAAISSVFEFASAVVAIVRFDVLKSQTEEKSC